MDRHPEIDHGFVARFNVCVERCKNLAELSRRSGIARSTLIAYQSGGDPTREKLVAISVAANVSVAWLATGEGTTPDASAASEPAVRGFKGQRETLGSAYVPQAHVPAPPADEVRLPVMSIEASAGNGAAVLKEEIAEYMSLSRTLVRSLGLSPGESFVIPARGESMEPLLKGGEPLICSSAERHLKAGDGIYVIRLEGDILVKHVQRLPGGKLRIASENKNYAPFEVALNDGTDFAILGKVLHALRQV